MPIHLIDLDVLHSISKDFSVKLIVKTFSLFFIVIHNFMQVACCNQNMSVISNNVANKVDGVKLKDTMPKWPVQNQTHFTQYETRNNKRYTNAVITLFIRSTYVLLRLHLHQNFRQRIKYKKTLLASVLLRFIKLCFYSIYR